MYNIIVSSILFVNAILAFYQVFNTWRSQNRARNIKMLTSILAFSSAIWSLFFAYIFLMTSPDAARVCRGIGLVGVILYLVSAEVLVGELTTIRKGLKHFFYMIGTSGFLLLPFISSKQGAIYYMTDHGMAFKMPNTISNTLYSVYCVLIAIIIFYFIYNIISTATIRRMKVLGYGLISIGVIITIGMVADTVLPPLIGIESFPASSITQFWGVAMMLTVLHFHEKSSISVNNMSNFIYYSLSVPVIVYDPYMNPSISNDAVYEFIGRDRLMTGPSEITLDALFGISAKEIIESEKKQLHYIKKCLSTGATCRITIDPITDRFGDILGYIANINDISVHILALEKVEEAKAMAEKSNKTKTVFLANVSHEIRTPLNSIVGFTELLLNSNLRKDEQEYASDIMRSSKSLLGIVQNVLDISQIESGTFELNLSDFDPKDLLRDVCRIIEPQITLKDVIFKIDISEKLPSVIHGDKQRIAEILTNLLGNAIRNTNIGSVSLHVSPRTLADGSASIHIEVQDTGAGIKAEDIDNLFDTFAQVDGHVHEGVEGSGFELALTKSYIKCMNGQINVVSKLGYGSDFIVDIPIQIIDSTAIGDVNWLESENIASSLGHRGFENLKVLIVDDSKINVKVFAHILKTYGIVADTVYSGQASIDNCEQKEYDIVFMDQMMPEMDGIEAMRGIRKISGHYAPGGHCMIVAFTANAVKGAAEQLIKEGFDAYMSKPVDLKILDGILNRI